MQQVCLWERSKLLFLINDFYLGFIKIIKKYDKVFRTSNLATWKIRINSEIFSTTTEVQSMLDICQSLVSRDKLLDWERMELNFYSDKMNENTIFPRINVYGLIVSISLFGITYFFPLLPITDGVAAKCFSLLIFIISLWVTEAIPYFATALFIPVLVTVMSVLKKSVDINGVTVSVLMNPEESAQFVMSHMFNHTTVSILDIMYL